jgi:hypothetical protein
MPPPSSACLSEHLRLDAARLNHLFSGQRVVIKRSIERELGLRHVQQFARLGARLLIEDVEAAVARPLRTDPSSRQRRPGTARESHCGCPAEQGRRSLPGAAGRRGGTPQKPAITCPTCGEVQPQAVFCRSCVTNMPMGIAARAETQAAANPPAEAPARAAPAPRAAPEQR